MTPPLLTATQLAFAFPGQPPLFSGLNLAVGAGVTWLLGNESTGKTTLLRLMAGEWAPTSGTLERQGGAAFWVDPRQPPADTTAQVWLQAQSARWPAWDTAALAEHVAGFELTEHLHKPLLALSTGGRRKLGLAAALASGAALTLIDEPTGGLDRPSIRHLCAALAARAGGPRAFVVAGYEPLPGVPQTGVIDLDQPPLA